MVIGDKAKRREIQEGWIFSYRNEIGDIDEYGLAKGPVLGELEKRWWKSTGKHENAKVKTRSVELSYSGNCGCFGM